MTDQWFLCMKQDHTCTTARVKSPRRPCYLSMTGEGRGTWEQVGRLRATPRDRKRREKPVMILIELRRYGRGDWTRSSLGESYISIAPQPKGGGPAQETDPLGRCLSVAAYAAIFSTSRMQANVAAKSGKIGQLMPSRWRLSKFSVLFLLNSLFFSHSVSCHSLPNLSIKADLTEQV